MKFYDARGVRYEMKRIARRLKRLIKTSADDEFVVVYEVSSTSHTPSGGYVTLDVSSFTFSDIANVFATEKVGENNYEEVGVDYELDGNTVSVGILPDTFEGKIKLIFKR